MKNISKEARERRKYWVEEIQKLSGNFGSDSEKLKQELEREMETHGTQALIDHLRLCGNIPEAYSHDSIEEKLYSKYTDNLLAFAYQAIGLKSFVLKERADVADVEAFATNYSFVADAKAFRLSRTAKNQKDFKVQAMNGWKHGKPYAMIVCPIHQLPHRSSQIYKQASTSNVCIFTYSHLSLLLNYSLKEGKEKTAYLLHEIFRAVSALNPSKHAVDYWLSINKTILSFAKSIQNIWNIEKMIATEATEIAKQEGLHFLASERERIMRMNHEEALKELIQMSRIENKIETIKSTSNNQLFDIQ